MTSPLGAGIAAIELGPVVIAADGAVTVRLRTVPTRRLIVTHARWKGGARVTGELKELAMKDNQYVDVTFTSNVDAAGNQTTFNSFQLSGGDPAVIEVGPAKDDQGVEIADTDSKVVRRLRALGPLAQGLVFSAQALDVDGALLGPNTFSQDVTADDASDITASVGTPTDQ